MCVANELAQRTTRHGHAELCFISFAKRRILLPLPEEGLGSAFPYLQRFVFGGREHVGQMRQSRNIKAGFCFACFLFLLDFRSVRRYASLTALSLSTDGSFSYECCYRGIAEY